MSSSRDEMESRAIEMCYVAYYDGHISKETAVTELRAFEAMGWIGLVDKLDTTPTESK